MVEVTENEIFGFIRPEIDAHTLGISTVSKLVEDCGYRVIIADATIVAAMAQISKLDNISLIIKWIRDHLITRLGLSFRLDPEQAQIYFGKLHYHLLNASMFWQQGGPIKQIYFAGLMESCLYIKQEYSDRFPVFFGDETQFETLVRMGIPRSRIPVSIVEQSKYDIDRLSFAESLIKSGNYKLFQPPYRAGYTDYGTDKDTVVKRIISNKIKNNTPIIRAHAGPYNRNYEEAKKEFLSWLHSLSKAGYLDVISIGSSQLSQSNFGSEWGDKPNGGGVPINSEKDLYNIWQASRPMLVRTYSATRNVPQVAQIFENTIRMAWHALSLWWFNKIDGRGPNGVLENLQEHFSALDYIAKTGKPFEPNIPHHFSFRGGDDYSYVLSAYLAAILAKKKGIPYIIIQTMLNTPKYTWGIQDLAKSRALLKLVRELENQSFKVFHQPRAGLDYFSPDLDKAKIQLAAVTALMDDIEPNNPKGPDIIHVVSYCEARHLATPDYINESIQITLDSLTTYREQKRLGLVDYLNKNYELEERTTDLYREVKNIVSILEKHIPNLYTPHGFYEVFRKGVFPTPYLWECKDEFKEAIGWKTNIINGAVNVVDENNMPIIPSARVRRIFNDI
ncbi:MAG TPA: hypothetical protein PKV18_07110 [Tenuifilaceae bacterium]|nr:hypothetical protein [Tenuifilaceae bacterium]HPC69147.1 hypothetical protein [Tenuifilaceae bacterium]HRS46740.1 hypothetical protein [Tenuifilaceae bacterium]HRV12721.1 hypothetical protein [Tenuifilaceae bacterium]